MSAVDACTVAAGHDRVHRYVARTLTADELDEFEPHLLACVTCQALVREGLAIRGALGAPAAAAPRRTRRLVLAAVPAVAAVVALWVAARPADPLAALARVGVPPAFAGLAVRDASDSGTTFADRGMAAYTRGRWADAADLLGRAGDAATPPVRFYHGIALLAAGRPADALEPLERAAADAAYAGDARLYRAKGWLALGRADSALVDLDRASATGGAAAIRALALADSVRNLTQP